MRKSVELSEDVINFLGYGLKEDGYLNSTTSFGCQSDWPDMSTYARKLDVQVVYIDGKTKVIIGNEFFDETCQLQKVLFNLTIHRDVEKSKQMCLQGPFLGMCNIQVKASHSVLYYWSINDNLVKFTIKTRLRLLPSNCTTHVWNRTNDVST